MKEPKLEDLEAMDEYSANAIFHGQREALHNVLNKGQLTGPLTLFILEYPDPAVHPVSDATNRTVIATAIYATYVIAKAEWTLEKENDSASSGPLGEKFRLMAEEYTVKKRRLILPGLGRKDPRLFIENCKEFLELTADYHDEYDFYGDRIAKAESETFE